MRINNQHSTTGHTQPFIGKDALDITVIINYLFSILHLFLKGIPCMQSDGWTDGGWDTGRVVSVRCLKLGSEAWRLLERTQRRLRKCWLRVTGTVCQRAII